jgi:hypothetical protein
MAVKPNSLEMISGLVAYAGSPSVTLIYNASTFPNMTVVSVCNTGSDAIYIGTSGLTYTTYFKSLTDGETWEFPLSYMTGSSNNLYGLRKTSQTGSTLFIMSWGEA